MGRLAVLRRNGGKRRGRFSGVPDDRTPGYDRGERARVAGARNQLFDGRPPLALGVSGRVAVRPWRFVTPTGTGTPLFDLSVTEAIEGVIVDQSGGLHVGVANDRPHKLEPAPFQVFTHGF